jgi:hypothetical protein
LVPAVAAISVQRLNFSVKQDIYKVSLPCK